MRITVRHKRHETLVPCDCLSIEVVGHVVELVWRPEEKVFWCLVNGIGTTGISVGELVDALEPLVKRTLRRRKKK